MEQAIRIGQKEVNMKVTANTPRLYREMFGKDLIVEMQGLLNHIGSKGEVTKGFDFGVVERLAYTMAYQYDRTIGSIDEWLDGFDGIEDMYLAMSDILKVWNSSKTTTSEPKKKTAEQ